jgi:hypothetical protein
VEAMPGGCRPSRTAGFRQRELDLVRTGRTRCCQTSFAEGRAASGGEEARRPELVVAASSVGDRLVLAAEERSVEQGTSCSVCFREGWTIAVGSAGCDRYLDPAPRRDCLGTGHSTIPSGSLVASDSTGTAESGRVGKAVIGIDAAREDSRTGWVAVLGVGSEARGRGYQKGRTGEWEKCMEVRRCWAPGRCRLGS